MRRAVLPGQVVPLTPALTADWLALPAAGLHLWASAARAYRAPTLNERYWSPGGNPDLLPETSAGYQVGASIGPQRSAENATWPAFFRAEIVAFDQRIREWVQWTPDAGTGLWSPRNLRRVRSRGAEGTLEVALPGRQTTLRLAGQLLETRKTAGLATDPAPAGIQLPYVPARTGSATLAYARPLGRRLTLGADANATVSSQRTTNAAGTETLPAYGLLHAGLRGAWHRPATATVSLRLDAFNLLDTDYQSQTNRPMPGRAWQLTLAVQTP